jgi:hypothetical protein
MLVSARKMSGIRHPMIFQSVVPATMCIVYSNIRAQEFLILQVIPRLFQKGRFCTFPTIHEIVRFS